MFYTKRFSNVLSLISGIILGTLFVLTVRSPPPLPTPPPQEKKEVAVTVITPKPVVEPVKVNKTIPKRDGVIPGLHYPVKEDDLEYGEEQEFILPFLNFSRNYMVSQKYKIAGCSIRKSMSQFMTNSMCYLFNETQFIEENNSFNDTWQMKRSCDGNSDFLMMDGRIESDPEFTLFAFVRDPFERFASLYVNKCIGEHRCYGCKDNMRCVVRSIYRDLLMSYYVPSARRSYDTYHVIPQSWACNFAENLQKFKIIKIGVNREQRQNAIMQFRDILVSKNVPKSSIEYVAEQALTSETSHSTYSTNERILAEHQIEHDPVVRHYLHLIYFYDYKVFGFNRDKLDLDYQLGDNRNNGS